MKNIIAVVNMNGGIWLNNFEILSFNKVSIVSFLSFFIVSSEAAVGRDIKVKVPFLVGVVGSEQSEGEVSVKTCNNFKNILSKAAWLKREENLLSASESEGADFGGNEVFGMVNEGEIGGGVGNVFAPTEGLLFKPQLGNLQ